MIALRSLPSTHSLPLLALAFAIAACGACSGDDTKLDVAAAGAPQNAASRIETAAVTSEALSATIAASGTIEAKRLTDIGADVPGTLASVLVEVGQSVRVRRTAASALARSRRARPERGGLDISH